MERIWPILGMDRRWVCGSTVSQAKSHTGWDWRDRPYKFFLPGSALTEQPLQGVAGCYDRGK